jgi:hypothetical protein
MSSWIFWWSYLRCRKFCSFSSPFEVLGFLTCSYSELVLKLRILRQVIGLLGRRISPSQGSYLHRAIHTQKTRSCWKTNRILSFDTTQNAKETHRPSILQVKVKVTLRPTTIRSVSPGFKAHEGLTTWYLFLLTFTSIVLSISGAPSDERSGLSFVIVIVRPLLVKIYM